MSNSIRSPQSGATTTAWDGPRAIIHKKILDVAGSRPDASMQDVAREVTGATTDLVERVLEEYGDPGVKPSKSDSMSEPEVPEKTPDEAAEQPTDESGPGPDDTGNSDDNLEFDGPLPEFSELTECQVETLDAITRHPTDTQRELAARFDLSSAAISQRVNSIPGFDWAKREAFAKTLLDGNTKAVDQPTMTTLNEPARDRIDDLETTVDMLEERLDDDCDEESGPVLEPELASKLLYACTNADSISEQENLEIFRIVLCVTRDS